jgi:membrane fusion protein (multidrug efflux system)
MNERRTHKIAPRVLVWLPYVRLLSVVVFIAFLVYACSSSAGPDGMAQPPPPELPVVAVVTSSATTYQEFSAALEGSKDIEIRPQVDGYLERIYVDEGAYVRKGQLLFRINDRPYRAQLNNARAS